MKIRQSFVSNSSSSSFVIGNIPEFLHFVIQHELQYDDLDYITKKRDELLKDYNTNGVPCIFNLNSFVNGCFYNILQSSNIQESDFSVESNDIKFNLRIYKGEPDDDGIQNFEIFLCANVTVPIDCIKSFVGFDFYDSIMASHKKAYDIANAELLINEIK